MLPVRGSVAPSLLELQVGSSDLAYSMREGRETMKGLRKLLIAVFVQAGIVAAYVLPALAEGNGGG